MAENDNPLNKMKNKVENAMNTGEIMPDVFVQLMTPFGTIPTRESKDAVGFDLYAARPALLQQGERALVHTDIKISMPKNLEAQVRPRSGLALKKGLTVLNAPGTIDPDYRGEVGVILINLGYEVASIGKGDRIAQLVFNRITRVELLQASDLDKTERGEGGFGSTGS